ncbi:hypothetical protein EI94DRAFT_1804545 [Lactarius quietus]|nr:hypothetical protein EI94DRAFT_1804545 [Lactarius quietus]
MIPIRLLFISTLGILRFHRYMLSNQREDLDKSIVHLTETILFPSRSSQVLGSKIIQTLSFLARALLTRARVNKLPEDAIYAAKYFRHLRDQHHQSSRFPLHRTTVFLIDALACQVELGAGGVMVNLGEMAVLCRELLTSNTPSIFTDMPIAQFLVALLSNLKVSPPELGVWDPDQPVDQFIECLRAAREYQLFRAEVRIALACCLYVRYSNTSMNDDYEEAASMLDEVITSSSPEDSFVAPAYNLVTMLAILRSCEHQNPGYSEEAIYRVRDFLGSSSVKEPFYPGLVFNLEGATKKRSLHFRSDIADLKELFRNSSLSQLGLRMSGMSVAGDDDSVIGRLYKNADLFMELLFGISDTNDRARVDEAIQKGRSILASESSSPRDSPTSLYSLLFGEILFEAFMHTSKVEYLIESISIRRQVLDREHPLRPLLRFRILHQLSLSLFIRSKMLSSYFQISVCKT